jgi:hypothetical protein
MDVTETLTFTEASFLLFIKRIVQSLKLRAFRLTSSELDPYFEDQYGKAVEFDRFSPVEPSKEYYRLYNTTAQAAGGITAIIPDEAKKHLVKRVRPMEASHISNDETNFDTLFYNQKLSHASCRT